MALTTVEVDGILLGFSKDNYSDLSFDITQACLLLGISRERFRLCIKEAKEVMYDLGNASFTCDPTSEEWISYEHLRKVAVWLSVRGNRVAKEFYYLATNVSLIETFNYEQGDPQAFSNLEQWSIHHDWVTRIGFVLDLALDPFATSEGVIMPFLSIDPITWKISERIAEYGFRAEYVTLRQIKFDFLAKCPDRTAIVSHNDEPNDIEIGFEFLPLLDECIREIVQIDGKI